jgi:WD40 repeat protein
VSKFTGANYAFNNQWTVVESVKDRDGNITGWEFTCGCGHESSYTEKRFIDPHEAAVTAMEFHVCED